MSHRVLAVVLGAATLAAVLAGEDGGYFPVSWGWAAGALGVLAAWLLLTERGGPRGRLETLFAGGLAAFAGWTLLSASWSQSAPSSIAEFQRALVPAGGALAALCLRRRDASPLLAGALGAATAISLANLGDRILGSAPGTGGESAPIGYANGLGILAAVGLLLGLGAVLGDSSSALRLAAALSLVPNGGVLLLSGSTGAVGALVLGLAVAGIVAGGRLRLGGLAVAAAALAVGVLSAGGHERGAYWSVALDAAAEHPVLGTGAGTFWQVWLRERDEPRDTMDAHGLYVETLSEQGPAGLALLATALAAPLAAVRRARRPLVAGAYAALLAHAGLDWDWELTGVMLVGLAVGASLLLEARPEEPARRKIPLRWLALAAALGAAALAGLPGALTLAQARTALRAGDTNEAVRHAQRASDLAPWASEPWLVAAQAHAGAGRVSASLAAVRRGLRRDENDWRLWAAAADVADGGARERALARARSLNPLGGL